MNVRTQLLVRRLTLNTLIAGLCVGIAWGQATRSADAASTEPDPSGGAVPGITVNLRDIGKNTERTLTRNDTGPLVSVIDVLQTGISHVGELEHD